MFLIAGNVNAQKKVINVADFGIKSDGSDATSSVLSALNACKESKADTLIFPKGKYNFWPDKATEKYMFISNNGDGLKRVVFPLNGFENLVINGQGSEFVFHGYICPFIIDGSKNIQLINFSIDWKRTFHSEGIIMAVHENAIDVEFSETFPFKVENSRLLFTDEEKRLYPFSSLLEFDSNKMETAFMAKDYYCGPDIIVEKIAERKVRLFVPGIKGTPGNVLVFGALNRDCPAITITHSVQIKLAGLDIFHCGGMGVIAQRSRDIDLDYVRVTPSPVSGRMISITADATHFVSCSGKIVMQNCLFENQKDDATNIHGIYGLVTGKISPTSIEIKLKHELQAGFDLVRAGEKVEFLNSASMVSYAEAFVKNVSSVNKTYLNIIFDEKVSEQLKIGDVISLVECQPDVVLRNCIIRKNRARGILLGSRGKILIENNTFHTPGAAILFEGDARFWYEQAGVRDVKIINNIFDNCNYGVWGNAVIQFGPGIEKSKKAISRYNRNILIEKNNFIVFDPRIINGYSIDSLVFQNNSIKKSNQYENRYANAKPFEITESSNIYIEAGKGN
ncbi:right-handed parallel beta-helix repeat-containing protein [Pedobacter nyackensis]|uniref:right-handed parallel beta-helix repeat-containing protein n=1 Tax=Pedobacter nyackensis TaxID=475255 RepID=UPI002930C3A7|nr:right-handed parallel beta-helix repeat-containing protein [Pedobacter nyackensis]